MIMPQTDGFVAPTPTLKHLNRRSMQEDKNPKSKATPHVLHVASARIKDGPKSHKADIVSQVDKQSAGNEKPLNGLWNDCKILRSVLGTLSSDIQLKRFELATNGTASRTSGCSASGLLANEDIYAFLTQATYTFGAGVTIFQY